jgi:hypothetical protein
MTDPFANYEVFFIPFDGPTGDIPHFVVAEVFGRIAFPKVAICWHRQVKDAGRRVLNASRLRSAQAHFAADTAE